MRKRRAGLRWSKRLTIASTVAIFAVIAGTGTVLADQGGWLFFGTSDNAWPYNNPGPAPVLAAVGDISCQPGSPDGNEKSTDVCTGGVTAAARNAAQNATAEQVEAMHPALVAVLGDEQYQNGYYSDFENSFDKYWGAFKFIQRPTPGNHEFYDNHGQSGVRGLGYFDYYNGIEHNADGSEIDTTVTDPTTAAPVTTPTGADVTQPEPQQDGQAGAFGATGDGWYSYNLGRWHLISLNIECAHEPGGCSTTSTTSTTETWLASETKWLGQDLSQDHSQCTIAYWHQPTFSSTASPFTSDSAEGQAADAWWKLLYTHHATLILNGHDHVYSRFAPMDPAGNADQRRGIREFIIGTGGESLDTVVPSTPNLQAWADQYYGVMKFTLGPGWYRWDYKSAMESPGAPAGTASTYSDAGSGLCNGPAGIGS